MSNETEEQFRARLEDIPTHGQLSPFVQRLLKRAAQKQLDYIGVLLEVFSPGRFQFMYWRRFGLPDLSREFADLKLKERVAALEPLMGEELQRLRLRVNEVVIAWIDWRQRAIEASVRDALRSDNALIDWMNTETTLKGEWDDLGEQIDNLRTYLLDVADHIERKEEKQTQQDNAERSDSVASSEESDKPKLNVAKKAVGFDEDSHLSPSNIAKACGVSLGALRKRLERRRLTDDACYVEVQIRKKNEPQYLYYWGHIKDIVQQLKAADKTSNERPTKNNTQ